eukprot:2931994-Lingulodinium_polyedra.AAC.1
MSLPKREHKDIVININKLVAAWFPEGRFLWTTLVLFTTNPFARVREDGLMGCKIAGCVSTNEDDD